MIICLHKGSLHRIMLHPTQNSPPVSPLPPGFRIKSQVLAMSYMELTLDYLCDSPPVSAPLTALPAQPFYFFLNKNAYFCFGVFAFVVPFAWPALSPDISPWPTSSMSPSVFSFIDDPYHSLITISLSWSCLCVIAPITVKVLRGRKPGLACSWPHRGTSTVRGTRQTINVCRINA